MPKNPRRSSCFIFSSPLRFDYPRYGRGRIADARAMPGRAILKPRLARWACRLAIRLAARPRWRWLRPASTIAPTCPRVACASSRTGGIVPSERGSPPVGMTQSSCEWLGSAGMSPATAITSCRPAGSQLATTFICLSLSPSIATSGVPRACTTGAGAVCGCRMITSPREAASAVMPTAIARHRPADRRSATTFDAPRSMSVAASILFQSSPGGETASTSSNSDASRPRHRATSPANVRSLASALRASSRSSPASTSSACSAASACRSMFSRSSLIVPDIRADASARA